MKTGTRIAFGFLVALLLLCAVTPANPAEIIAAHNAYRNEVGVVPLNYSIPLAASAQAWAEHNAEIGSMVHSGSSGENIAVWSAGYASWTDIVDLWGSEKSDFLYGPFGDGSSKTGHWYDVGHYTQIVWSTTTHCGCGKATNGTQNAEYFVCQYDPPGNYWGQYPYPPVVRVPDKIGVFRNLTHLFYKDYNGNGLWNGAVTDRSSDFGIAGDLPLTGDWDADGTTEIGIFRPSAHLFYLDYNGNGLWNGAVTDRVYNFGITGDLPLTGDWNADGTTEIGIFRPSTHLFYLDYNGNGVWNGAVTDRVYNFGITGDLPVTGDWNADGTTEIGIFRPATHLYYRDFSGNGVWDGAVTDRVSSFGISGDIPLSGDWNSDDITEIGVFRPLTHLFYLDYNGNGVWNGAGADRSSDFGITGDIPVTGKW